MYLIYVLDAQTVYLTIYSLHFTDSFEWKLQLKTYI